MRQPSGDKDGKYSARGYWLALADGPNEGMRERAEQELAKEPEIPEALAHVHAIWCDLDIGRRYGMNGSEPISYSDIYAWRQVSEQEITAEEVGAVLYMDRVVLAPGKKDDGK